MHVDFLVTLTDVEGNPARVPFPDFETALSYFNRTRVERSPSLWLRTTVGEKSTYYWIGDPEPRPEY